MVTKIIKLKNLKSKLLKCEEYKEKLIKIMDSIDALNNQYAELKENTFFRIDITKLESMVIQKSHIE